MKQLSMLFSLHQSVKNNKTAAEVSFEASLTPTQTQQVAFLLKLSEFIRQRSSRQTIQPTLQVVRNFAYQLRGNPTHKPESQAD